MNSVPERFCARGERCKLYDPEKGRPQKLGPSHKADICDKCRRAEADADLDAHQCGLSIDLKKVRFGENSLKARIVTLKRNLVARMIAKRGPYWEAIREVRARWRLEPVSTQLPPESDDILHPPGLPAREPPRPEEYILPPDIPNPYTGEPGKLEEYESWSYDKKRWLSDLDDVLLRFVPERYLEEGRPYAGWPPSQERWLPWYRFVAGCVLYDPPVEEAPAFADYGGIPLSSGEGTKAEPTPAVPEPTPAVLSERGLREAQIDLQLRNIVARKVFERVWELRSELGDLDFRQAWSEVDARFHDEWEEEYNRVRRELYEREILLASQDRCYVEFVPGETGDREVLKALGAIRARAEEESKGGQKRDDDLRPVMCAKLLKKPGWTAEVLAARSQPKLSENRVNELAREGEKFLDA